ncbi:hypothetical protein ACT9XH_00595 [Methanococcoides methylutens]|uniref:hypothetical protein n=1 Tax=Methanococcoides methylutens TaxID=2226 RepID=UPI004044BC30
MSEPEGKNVVQLYRFVNDIKKIANKRGFGPQDLENSIIMLNLEIYKTKFEELGEERTIELFELDMEKLRQMFFDMLDNNKRI